MPIHPTDLPPSQRFVTADLDLRTEKQKPKPKRVRLSTVLLGVFLVLVLLKQLHILEVSWWWICLPIYLIPAGYALLIAVIILIWLGQELWYRLRFR